VSFVNVILFCVMTTCSLVGLYECFTGTFCCHLQERRKLRIVRNVRSRLTTCMVSGTVTLYESLTARSLEVRKLPKAIMTADAFVRPSAWNNPALTGRILCEVLD
jgi:hypothetical protein